jgi:HD-GYP domain-containing protein (c-di-GMP phosphodiesterase class II)
MQNAKKLFEQNKLSFKLIPVSIRELFVIKKSPVTFFIFKDHLFEPLIKVDDEINIKIFKELLNQGITRLFVTNEDRIVLNDFLKDELTKSARSLSIGDIKSNVSQQTNLLTLTLSQLYHNPLDDHHLKLQYQTAKNLSQLIIENINHIKDFYQDYEKQKHYFILSQPMQSSLLLMGFLDSIKLFNDKEIEYLFLASYFKDIGMSLVPSDLYNKSDLNHEEKLMLAEHSLNSVEILKNRLPFQSHHLEIIANHHQLNPIMQGSLSDTFTKDDGTISGVETILVALMDVIVASTHHRPYREAASLFSILERVKEPLSKEYPAEFKALVYFLRRFFTR